MHPVLYAMVSDHRVIGSCRTVPFATASMHATVEELIDKRRVRVPSQVGPRGGKRSGSYLIRHRARNTRAFLQRPLFFAHQDSTAHEQARPLTAPYTRPRAGMHRRRAVHSPVTARHLDLRPVDPRRSSHCLGAADSAVPPHGVLVAPRRSRAERGIRRLHAACLTGSGARTGYVLDAPCQVNQGGNVSRARGMRQLYPSFISKSVAGHASADGSEGLGQTKDPKTRNLRDHLSHNRPWMLVPCHGCSCHGTLNPPDTRWAPSTGGSGAGLHGDWDDDSPSPGIDNTKSYQSLRQDTLRLSVRKRHRDLQLPLLQ